MRGINASSRLAGLLLGLLLLAGCEAAGDGTGGDTAADTLASDTTADAPPADLGPADVSHDVPPADLPPADVSHDVPPADLPPADVPHDVPPADLPPADVPHDVPPDLPPTDVPPDEVIDEHCGAPSFPDQCGEVSEFQCGFMAACTAGTVEAAWHVHVFCSDDDPMEDIVDYTCSVICPKGCQEGTFYDWPQNGTELLEMFCDQCAAPADCEALDLPHDDCVGAWSCAAGRCGWGCDVPCVAEGQSAPVIPNAPACCAGLGKVPCDAPDADGVCQSCDGASVCVACGDGQCGPGENPCNCPADCTNEPVDLCALAGGSCTELCNEGGMAEYVVADAGCKEGSVCCVPDYDGCFGLGGGFLDFDTEGKCCEGLVASSDCDVMEDGSCSCPKCPCYVCLPCGDGVCGPFEHACNCPADCGPTAKVLPSTQSDCQGSGAPTGWNPAGDDGAGIATVTVEGSTIKLLHEGLKQNCCAVIEVRGTVDATHHAIRLEELHALPYTPCFCECFFTVTAELADVPSGTWTVTLYNEELGYDLGVYEITVP